jgi:hypothetical protein
MVLLCASHHKLVHEGGYSVQRGHDNQLYFRRPDGKAVPHCGYRLDDQLDEGCDVDEVQQRMQSQTQSKTQRQTSAKPQAKTEAMNASDSGTREFSGDAKNSQEFLSRARSQSRFSGIDRSRYPEIDHETCITPDRRVVTDQPAFIDQHSDISNIIKESSARYRAFRHREISQH